MMLAFAKDLPHSWITESPGAWRPDFQLKSLYGSQLSLVGIGSIGTAVAVRASAFGMKIRALRRSPRGVDLPGVDIAATMADLLREADHVVIAAPLTPETRHIIDAAAFSSMKPGVHLVNISRGGLVDQDALRDALDRSIVGRASLDTVTPEPLPDGHWLYSHPRVLLSPHISYLWPHSKETLFSYFMENLRRFVRGEDLINVIDPAAGY
jgi:phosphoglycerate dehydrogenase-like enzyme